MIWIITLSVLLLICLIFVALQRLEIQKLRNDKAELDNRIDHLESGMEELRYAIVHDISAPLRAVHGFCEILKGRLKETVDEEIRELFSLIYENTSLMKSMIHDVREYYRVMNCAMKVESVDMNTLVKDCYDSLIEIMGIDSIQLNLQPLPAVQGDRDLLRILLKQLLSNAIKFTRNHEPPVIDVLHVNSCVVIQDQGVGFDMAYRDKVFKLFHRLHLKEQFEGNGAGLAIVSQIIKRHYGSISIESQSGQGTRVSFYIPDFKKST